MGNMIMITSGSGGAGKTTFAVNIACTCASCGASVLLLDLNTGIRSADIYLGLQDRIVFDLGDVFSGVCSVEKAIVESEACPGLSFLCSTQGKEILGVTKEHEKLLFEKLKSMFDVVIADCPCAVGTAFEVFAKTCDAALIVVTPDYASVRGADLISGQLGAMGLSCRSFAINRVKAGLSDTGLVPGPEYFEKVFQIPMAGIVCEDDNIAIGCNQGFPVALDPDSYIARNFADIAAGLLK